MKRILTILSYMIIPALGLIWSIGCSTGPTGSTKTSGYGIALFVQPDSVYADSGKGVVHCFLTYGNSRITSEETIKFRAASGDTLIYPDCNSTLTSAAYPSDTADTGTEPEVHYFPNNYLGDADTIYALFTNTAGDTLVCNSTIVPILHPEPPYNIALDVQPDTIMAYTGEGIVYCFLTYGYTPVDGEQVHFRAASQYFSNSTITSTAWSSVTSASGTIPSVYYCPNNYGSDLDTIYALFTNPSDDTLAWDSTIVYIQQP